MSSAPSARASPRGISKLPSALDVTSATISMRRCWRWRRRKRRPCRRMRRKRGCSRTKMTTWGTTNRVNYYLFLIHYFVLCFVLHIFKKGKKEETIRGKIKNEEEVWIFRQIWKCHHPFKANCWFGIFFLVCRSSSRC